MRIVNGKKEIFHGRPLLNHPHDAWPEFYVYIGRRGHGFSGYFGNPCGAPEGCPCGRKNPAHTAPLSCYKSLLDARCEADPVFREDVTSLWDPRVTLVCFCRPRLCHGDFLLLKAAELNGGLYVPDVQVPIQYAGFFGPQTTSPGFTEKPGAIEEEFERQLENLKEEKKCQK